MAEATQTTEVRTAEERQDVLDAIYELNGDICKPCGRKKREMQSFCYPYFMKLPGQMKRDLYKTIFDGYAEVYKEAKQYLAGLKAGPAK